MKRCEWMWMDVDGRDEELRREKKKLISDFSVSEE